MPAWSHLVVDMVLATVTDAEVPFTMQMSTTAYDWIGRTDAGVCGALDISQTAFPHL